MKKLVTLFLFVLLAVTGNSQTISIGTAFFKMNDIEKFGISYGISWKNLMISYTSSFHPILSENETPELVSGISVGYEIPVGRIEVIPIIGYYTTNTDWIYQANPAVQIRYCLKDIKFYAGTSIHEYVVFGVGFPLHKK